MSACGGRDELLATAQGGASDEKHPTRRMAPEAVGAVRHSPRARRCPVFTRSAAAISDGAPRILSWPHEFGGPAAAGNLRTPHAAHRLFLTLQARPHRIPASGVARDARVVRTEDRRSRAPAAPSKKNREAASDRFTAVRNGSTSPRRHDVRRSARKRRSMDVRSSQWFRTSCMTMVLWDGLLSGRNRETGE